MQPIHSGTTTERLVRSSMLTALICGFAIAFLWDGYVGYPRDNARQLMHSLGLSTDAAPVINQELTELLADRVLRDVPSGEPVERLTAGLGRPSFEHGDGVYYLGPGGHVRAGRRSDRIQDLAWVPGPHTETDLTLQKWCGYVLAVFGAVLVVLLVRVLRTRATLTQDGLHVRGKPLISFEVMTSLRPDQSRRGTGVRIEYKLNDSSGVIRLDDYTFKRYDAIVSAICERKHFPDPLGVQSRGREPADR